MKNILVVGMILRVYLYNNNFFLVCFKLIKIINCNFFDFVDKVWDKY